ncbi:MAG: hypothetical protein KC561_18160, partial [Myxococcales bacterium]|nr:hypothetical protein [Myxococcales bacterium]
ACGDGSGSEADMGQSGDPTTLEDFCAAASQNAFSYLQNCYGRAAYPDSEREPYSESTREICAETRTAVDAGRLGYDAYMATACVAQMGRFDCIEGPYPDPCPEVFQPLVPLGGTCYADEARHYLAGERICAEGYCSRDACPAVCEPFAARGESCAIASCQPTDWCVQNTCVARAAVGEACDGDIPCAEGLSCRDGECIQGLTSQDDPCSSHEDCYYGVCIDSRCEFQVQLGDPCRGVHNCPVDAICNIEDDELVGVCEPLRGLGGECRYSRECQDGLFCPSGQCAEYPEVGEPCLSSQCGEDAACRYNEDDGVEGTCRSRVGEGEPCLSSGFPQSTLCQDGLICMQTGVCLPPGELDEPCNVIDTRSCTEGLWCSRESQTCVGSAPQGAKCNPLWPWSCGEGLGCDCGLEDISECGVTPEESTEYDTCQPLVQAGGACYRGSECTDQFCEIDFEAPSTDAGTCIEAHHECVQ